MGLTVDGTRYRLLETMRQYGEERLADRAETGVLNDRHLDHFLAGDEAKGVEVMNRKVPEEAARNGDVGLVRRFGVMAGHPHDIKGA